MNILNVTQGTQEWHEARTGRFCASDAPAMLGLSKYTSRTALLDRMTVGVIDEPNAHQQALFDKGHDAESLAMSIAETLIENELYPVVGVIEIDNLPLLASFDGITIDESIIWEHKLLNKSLAAYIRENSDVPDTHWPQLEHQLLVSGADYVLFMVSDGTKDGMAWVEYHSQPERLQRLVDGWRLFSDELNTHQVIIETPVSEPIPIMGLPALNIAVTGQVLASNLEIYQERALAYINGINDNLDTDNDFEQAKLDIKFCQDAEKQLESAKERALSQTADIDLLFKTIDHISESLRAKRLTLTKLDKTRKDQIKVEIINQAHSDLNLHIKSLTEELGGVTLSSFRVDFAGAIKGKSKVAAMRDSVSCALANAKIETNRMAEQIRCNQEKFKSPDYQAHEFLFPDINTLAQKQPDDFIAALESRIANYKKEQDTKSKKTEDIKNAEQLDKSLMKMDQSNYEPVSEDIKPQDMIETIADGISGDQAIAFVDALISCGIRQTKPFHDAIAMLNTQSHDGLEGFRIEASLCQNVGELAAILNGMKADQKAKIKPFLTVVQNRLKQAA